jgi:hypothetical protein
MRSRTEHLDWCKQRALELLENGDLADAIASMANDLEKHPETKLSNPFLTLLAMQHVVNADREAVRRWITGFN